MSILFNGRLIDSDDEFVFNGVRYRSTGVGVEFVEVMYQLEAEVRNEMEATFAVDGVDFDPVTPKGSFTLRNANNSMRLVTVMISRLPGRSFHFRVNKRGNYTYAVQYLAAHGSGSAAIVATQPNPLVGAMNARDSILVETNGSGAMPPHMEVVSPHPVYIAFDFTSKTLPLKQSVQHVFQPGTRFALGDFNDKIENLRWHAAERVETVIP